MPKVSRKQERTPKTRRSPVKHRGTRLFVYGTLMRGGDLHKHLAADSSVKFDGHGRVRGELYALPGVNYPGAVPSERLNRFVFGEVYRIRNPNKTLKKLDELEGCAEGLFRRVRTMVFQNGSRVSAWTYFYIKPLNGARQIPSGSFPLSQ